MIFPANNDVRFLGFYAQNFGFLFKDLLFRFSIGRNVFKSLESLYIAGPFHCFGYDGFTNRLIYPL